MVAWSRQWLDGDQTAISFRSVTAGDTVEVAGYRVSVLAANHEAFGEACCYLIEDDTASLLYATDTGLLPESTLTALSGRRVDLVLLPVAVCRPPTTVDPDRAVLAQGPGRVRDGVLPWTVWADLCGLPACSVPAGLDDDGLPVGLQVVGPPGADARVLDVAAALAPV